MIQSIAVLTRYEAALNRGDSGALAGCHAGRFLHMKRRGGTSEQCWRVNDFEFQLALRTALYSYRELGVSAFRLASVSDGELHASHRLLRVAWQCLRRDGSEAAELDVSYLVRVTRHAIPDGGHAHEERIVALIDHDERGRLLARGLLDAQRLPLLFDSRDELELKSGQRMAISGQMTIAELRKRLEHAG